MTKAAWLIGAILSLVLTAATTLGAASVAAYRAGSVAVAVTAPSGPDFSVRVPAVLLDAAVVLLPVEVLREHAGELHGFPPVLRAAVAELRDCPDATLVEVRDRGDHVLVQKQGDRIRVRVLTAGERVDVAVPLGTLERLARKLDRAARPA